MLEVEPTVSVDVQPPEVAETSRDQFAATVTSQDTKNYHGSLSCFESRFLENIQQRNE